MAPIEFVLHLIHGQAVNTAPIPVAKSIVGVLAQVDDLEVKPLRSYMHRISCKLCGRSVSIVLIRFDDIELFSSFQVFSHSW